MAVPNSQGLVDPHALMVPVTFDNCHQAIRIRMPSGLNVPTTRFVPPELEQPNGYNIPCLMGHSLALRPPLLSECGYALPPHLVSSDGVGGPQPFENSAALALTGPGLPLQDNTSQQPLFTHHNGQPIALRLPLPSENYPQLVPYRSPNLSLTENRGLAAAPPLRRPNNDEGSPDIDSRIPPRFVRLEGTNFSEFRGNPYRPRRESAKDFTSGSPDS